ncbi:hypothetical protein Bca4012_066937 [Brassica carinata]|uniref:FAF domain-containing protein n=1 Tax=Brassica carinata TaxID=52824 RepID=A0A8X7VRC9_BRACI|nr:hypothetical protein Bca52824_019221 [Brassica carinata]
MATVVYQGFQSHFESQHFEQRALRLRLSSPNNPHSSTALKSYFLDSSITPKDNISTTKAASKSESWSFLESISNSSSDDKDKKTLLPPYVHTPSSRRTLSDESLALCTESLGSETGSDVINDPDLFSVTSELQTIETRPTTTRSSRQDRKRNTMASLPPPLTSMRGFDGIQVKSHRENGRLVMTAMKPLPRDRCLQDRSNGCVRLAILIDSNDHIETKTKEEEQTVKIVRDNEEQIQQYEEEEEVEEEKQEVEEMVIKNTQRSNRCHEGDLENRGFLNWESFCVATS